jgi:uncharacterized protein YciI
MNLPVLQNEAGQKSRWIKMAKEAEFLYRLNTIRPDLVATGPTPEEMAVLEDHTKYLGELTAKGVVILAGRTLTEDEHTFGIVVFRARALEAAQQIMEDDPSVKKGVMRAELFPFRVAWSSRR